jgi:hypothetical protein
LGYWADSGFSFYETFVATGENFPDALAGGQLAGGKYYASTSETARLRWQGVDYKTPKIKAASPILLTKDGNRSADSVIASNLAWNWGKVSVDAYEFINSTLADYLDNYLSGNISDVIDIVDADGFFTNVSPVNISDDTLVGLYEAYEDAYNDWEKNPTTENYEAVKLCQDLILDALDEIVDPEEIADNEGSAFDVAVAWLDGYRVKDNNFNGVILGGKAAVSKDKAKQLDDTVKDSILKVNDPVAGYTKESTITIGGKVYHTLGWFYDQTSNWSNYLGVNGWGDNESTTGLGLWDDTFKANEVIAVPYGTYRYLYQPYSVKKIADDTVGKNGTQTFLFKFAKFDSKAGFARLGTNDYTGYGLTGYAVAEVEFTYVNGVNTDVDYSWVEVPVANLAL